MPAKKQDPELLRPKTKSECLEIAVLNQRNSPFLRLPAEIRNRIYVYGFSTDDYYLGSTRDWDMPPNFCAISQACRQLRDETSFMPYKLGTFIIANLWEEDVFFDLTEKQRAAVTKVEIMSYVSEAYPDWKEWGILDCLPSLEKLSEWRLERKGPRGMLWRF